MKIKELLLSTFVLLVCLPNSFAQTATIETENNAQVGQNYVIDVYLNDFTNTSPGVSAFQWTIQYDLAKLSFVNLTPVTPADGWVWYTPAQNPGKITFAVVPNASFHASSSTLICQIEFTYNGPGDAFLNWSDTPTPRHIYDDNIDEYFGITWVNGAINAAVGTAAVISQSPADQTINEMQNAWFAVAATGTQPMTYAWQISMNGGSSWTALTDSLLFSGASTDTLHINSVPLGMSGYQFRSSVVNGFGNDMSNPATLNVLPLTGINSYSSQRLTVYPNPASDLLTVFLPADSYHEMIISGLNAGKVFTAATSSFNGDNAEIDISGLDAGIYFLIVQCKDGSVLRSRFCVVR